MPRIPECIATGIEEYYRSGGRFCLDINKSIRCQIDGEESCPLCAAHWQLTKEYISFEDYRKTFPEISNITKDLIVWSADNDEGADPEIRDQLLRLCGLKS